MKETLYQYVQKFVKVKELPGLAVGIVKDNEIFLAEGFGVRSIETNEPVTATSVFYMASISKLFVANSIMQLVEQGLVDLSNPVVSYLPYFKIYDDRYREITVQQMLSHVSGMPDDLDYEWGNPYVGDDALEKFNRSLTDLKLKFEPGNDYAYSNIAYEILGDLIAKVTGLTFEEAIKEKLFSPLGMSNSTFLLAEVPSAKRVVPHERIYNNVLGTIYPYNRAHAPSSTLHSSAEDMCKWMLVNLNLGEYDGRRILQPQSYDRLWKEWFPSGADQSVGLSWFIGKHKEFKTVGHGGLVYGFRTQLTMIPEKGIGVTVMSNINPAPMVELANGLLDMLMGFSPPKPLKPVLFMMTNAYHKGGYQAALDILNECKEDESEYDFAAIPLIKLGDTLWDSGQRNQAIEILKLGLAMDPNSAGIHAFLAYMYHNLGEVEKGRVFFAKALELDSEDPVVKYMQTLVE